jgi:hypothetical protein
VGGGGVGEQTKIYPMERCEVAAEGQSGHSAVSETGH